MKLKCNDGVVRNFQISREEGSRFPDGRSVMKNTEAYCKGCGNYFGVHDTKILKPIFKEHVCLNVNKRLGAAP